MNYLFIGPIVALLVWATLQVRTLMRNYRAACATGLPIIICPYDPDSVVFAVVSEPVRRILKTFFPTSMPAAFEVTCWGWEFHDKCAVHERLGQAFVIVTTGHNRLICADATMAHSILARRKDFLHPDISLKTMGLLGPNLVTSKNESWSRQRRIIAPCFNERISLTVWKEGVQQASSLIEHMMSSISAPHPPSSTTSPLSDSIPGLRAVAINVLTRVAYDRHTPFSISSSYRDSGKSLSYVDAIALVTDLLLAAAFIPSSIPRLPFMPRLLRKLGQALVQLPNLTADMLDQERTRSSAASPDDVQNTIMTTLVRLSDQAQVKDQNHGKISASSEHTFANGSNGTCLTKDEISGNLFIFTAAGFDTTSNTMSYAIVLLAAFPQWQAWIQAEIDAVLGDHDGNLPEEDYAAIFPKLVRCLAIMFETLRLYPAVSMLIRTIETNQNILPSDSSSSFTLQAPCAVHVNIMALHIYRSVWGSDNLEFKPSRWLQSGLGGERFHIPSRGTYTPWSSGPRACPGQKMSQVEFVSVIMTIFRTCSVEPALEGEETMEQGRERLLSLLQDSQPVITLQMNRPREVRLRWTRR
ncbi:cytochrome P450 [Fusarium tricinctum]|uniref:Cytochrome P450 n=1 Tax=Fusarium tricinctum TaxID=61284 RepID=A0A8K0S321_9HYPO|nr:cytochrome P450 [Fusarium tricinctum]